MQDNEATVISRLPPPPSRITGRAKVLSVMALLLMIAGSVGLDQVSKIMSEKQLMVWQHDDNLKMYQGRPHHVWSNTPTPPARGSGEFYLYFGFNYVRNQGAAWGMLANLDDKIRIPFFYGMTALAILIILFYLKVTPFGHRFARLALALILSGAMGNFIDRVRVGYVIDWIDVRWNIFDWSYSFPNFNVADSCISVGVFMLLVDATLLEMLRRKKVKARNAVLGMS